MYKCVQSQFAQIDVPMDVLDWLHTEKEQMSAHINAFTAARDCFTAQVEKLSLFSKCVSSVAAKAFQFSADFKCLASILPLETPPLGAQCMR